MSVRAPGAAGSPLSALLPALDELGGLGVAAPGMDAASLRLEPVASVAPRPVEPERACARPLDPRVRALLPALGARASEVGARAPAELGAHASILAESAQAVVTMVGALLALEALERDAAVGRRRGALRA